MEKDFLKNLKAIVPEEIFEVSNKLKMAGFEAYLVGGAVRDLFINPDKIEEWDMATSATPVDVISIFERHYELGPKFGTVAVIVGKHHVEVTTFRSESAYADSRHPDVVKFISDIREDLGRRDFTVNALALDLDEGKIIDLYNGLDDIGSKIIRTVNNPYSRFKEDALRMMRAVRFAVTLDFELDDSTKIAISSMASDINKISCERVRDEFKKILISDNPEKGLKLLADLGLLKSNFGDVFSYGNFDSVIAQLNSLDNDFELRLAMLIVSLQADESGVLNKLKLSRASVKRIHNLVRSARTIDIELSEENDDKGELYFIEKTMVIGKSTGEDEFFNVLKLIKAYQKSVGNDIDIAPYLRAFNVIIKNNFPFSIDQMKISGSDLCREFDNIRGENVGILLKILHDKIVNGQVSNDLESLMSLARDIVGNRK